MQFKIVFRVGNSRGHHLRDEMRALLGHKAQDRQCLVCVLAAHLVAHEANLLGADRQAAGVCFDFHNYDLAATGAAASPSPFLIFFSARWPRNVRVGANSPSLWPTMFSVM